MTAHLPASICAGPPPSNSGVFKHFFCFFKKVNPELELVIQGWFGGVKGKLMKWEITAFAKPSDGWERAAQGS